MTEPASLHDLTARATSGDRAAFAELTGRFEGRLRAWIVIRTLLHVGPRLAVDEVLQETLVRARATIERLESALDDLDPGYSEALRLSWLDGLKVKEVAVRMGRSPDEVKQVLSRGLSQLRERFGDTRSLGLNGAALFAPLGDYLWQERALLDPAPCLTL